MINGLTSSNINNNNNNNNNKISGAEQLHPAKQQQPHVQQSPHLTLGGIRATYGHEVASQLMSGSEIQLQNDSNSNPNQNHYNSSNNPLSMMGGMMQMQQQQQQGQQGGGGSFSQHHPHAHPAQMLNNNNNNRQHPHLHPHAGPPQLVASQLNSSLELDDNELSGDEDDDELDNDLDELDAAKQQLIDGGSSSSTSLQATPSQHGGGMLTPGSKKDKPSYNCLLCPKSYRKRKSLLDHYKLHPGYCHDCGQPNGNTLEVRRHEIFHEALYLYFVPYVSL